MKQKIIDLTVVIPTLGEKSLSNCITRVNMGTILPKLILIVIPKDYSSKINKIRIPDNSKIIFTSLKGQVSQKIIGFKEVKTEFIMQLDSDIFLEKNTIEKLYEFVLKYKNKIAVAPLLLPNINHNYNSGLLSKIKNYIISGNLILKPGKITDIGYNTWFNNNEFKNFSYKVDWLPGGCILFRKNSVIKNNYYPFQNKAYCEDILHSLYLSKKKVKLFLIPSVQVENKGFKSKANLLQKLNEFRVRYFILEKIKGNKIRFFIWFLLHVIK